MPIHLAPLALSLFLFAFSCAELRFLRPADLKKRSLTPAACVVLEGKKHRVIVLRSKPPHQTDSTATKAIAHESLGFFESSVLDARLGASNPGLIFPKTVR